MFLFENYTPIFDESEFKDEERKLQKKEYQNPGDLFRSMATVITSLNQPINTDLLKQSLLKTDCRITHVSFFNQLSIIINVPIINNEIRSINTKIFGKGTIHMTGGYSIKECKKAIVVLLKYIKKFKTKICIIDDDEFKLKHPDFKHPEVMYCVNEPNIDINDLEFNYKLSNRNFLTNFEFCQGTLYNLLREKQFNVSYNPNSFAGLRFTKMINGSKLTYLIFSGKITLSINKDTYIVKDAYKYINDLIKDNYDTILQDTYRLL